MTRDEFIAAYEKHVTRQSVCWRWAGPYNIYDVPMLQLNGKSFGAAEVAFCCFHRELKEDEQVFRTCRRIYCVHPAHLEARKKLKFWGRGGEFTQLDAEEIKMLRRLYRHKHMKIPQLALKYNIPEWRVLDILRYTKMKAE